MGSVRNKIAVMALGFFQVLRCLIVIPTDCSMVGLSSSLTDYQSVETAVSPL